MPPEHLSDPLIQGGILGAAFWLIGTIAVPFGRRVLDKLDAIERAQDRSSRAQMVVIAALRQVDRETREAARQVIREIDQDDSARHRDDR